jgi:hypothetical protein
VYCWVSVVYICTANVWRVIWSISILIHKLVPLHALLVFASCDSYWIISIPLCSFGWTVSGKCFIYIHVVKILLQIIWHVFYNLKTTIRVLALLFSTLEEKALFQ